MIIREHFVVNNVPFTRTYSNKGMKIHGGEPEADYDIAEEPTEFGRTYTETDIPIESDSEAEEIINILTGVSE